MEKNGVVIRLGILGLYLCLAGVLVAQCRCDAGRTIPLAIKHLINSDTKPPRKFHLLMKDSSDTDTPFSMAPSDSLSPIPLGAQNTPPYCVYPSPSTPLPPFTIPTPVGYTPPSPPALSDPISPSPAPIPSTSPNSPTVSVIPSPPGIVPNPPTEVPTPTQPVLSPSGIVVPNPPTDVPTPTQPALSPPYYEPSPPISIPKPPYYEPSPPSSIPNPPYYEPSPPSYVPNPSHGKPPRFLAPIVYPPPTVPPPPRRAPATTLWCVAKPSVPDPIILEAMNYACGSGADCTQIQPSGSCFQPNTLFAHASFAFNSYWQRTKVARGICDFGGTAMLVTVDPSYGECHFVYF
ncbi:hypothetical protein OROGR_001276 [Orobanche gracilis]